MLPMQDGTTSEDRATQLLIWETLSLAIGFLKLPNLKWLSYISDRK